jgi:two-component system cell cycle response regulator
MVIDGSTVTREILARILRDEIDHSEVVTCKSGEEALALLAEQKFDLITTALLLSDMDGLALSRQIRDSNIHNYTPIIVVSGDADSRLLREGFEAGVTDYFDKSKGYKAFGSFIKSFIQRNSGLAGHILFVEDSRTAAAVTRKILEKHGLKVTHTTSAEEALKLLEKQVNKTDSFDAFDMVITDFYLVGSMTGGDLLHAIRVRFRYSQQELPVLVITGNDENQVEVFHAGGNDFVTKPIIEEVLLARVRALLLIKHQFDALKQQTEAMRWIAATDSLTGVRSKRYLLDNGEDFIHASHNQPVWAMLIDIDHFKAINDTLGHITGDHVLAELGNKLNSSFPDDIVVRFGGEEFCILIANIDREQMLAKAEQLRAEVEDLQPAEVDITISIGLATTEDHPNEPLTRFLALADKALYHAKENGRNQLAVCCKQGTQGHTRQQA